MSEAGKPPQDKTIFESGGDLEACSLDAEARFSLMRSSSFVTGPLLFIFLLNDSPRRISRKKFITIAYIIRDIESIELNISLRTLYNIKLCPLFIDFLTIIHASETASLSCPFSLTGHQFTSSLGTSPLWFSNLGYPSFFIRKRSANV